MEMLKKLAKRIEKEISQAEDYCQQAYLVKHEDEKTAKLFIDLCTEEIDHAKRLFAEGERLIDSRNPHVLPYEIKMNLEKSNVAMDMDTHFKECKAIWKWEQRTGMERIAEILYRVSQFQSMP